MKVATITCHNVYNHGALLQAWALTTYLRSCRMDAKIIDYQPNYLRGHYDLIVRNDKYNYPILKQLYLLVKYPEWRKSLRRKRAFDDFYNKYLKSLLIQGTYWTYKELKGNPPESDVYIAGSDQIWNTRFENGRDPAFYLDFGSNKIRRLSYAASFATDRLVEGYSEFVQKELIKFNAISVREKSGLQILNSLELHGSQVLDPVFLLDASVWKSLIVCPTVIPKEPYILIYDTLKTTELTHLISRLKKLTKMHVFTINGNHSRVADTRYKHIGPDGFIHLIANASLVISNSFHASAFSIIFKRDFFVMDRPDGLNRRMQDLLEMFGLRERHVNASTPDEILTSHIEYENIQSLIDSSIEKSKLWIKQSL